MATSIVTEGTISIASIRNEMGGSYNMSEYYRKGTNQKPVPNNGKNNSIPTSGSLYLSQYYGTSGWFASVAERTWVFDGAKGHSVGFNMWTGARVTAYLVVNASTFSRITIDGNRNNNYWKQFLCLTPIGINVTPAQGVRSYENGKTTWTYTTPAGGNQTGNFVSAVNLYDTTV